MSNGTMKNEAMDKEGPGGQLRRRLKSVRKRKRAQRLNFECETVALKMRLVKGEEDSNH